MGFSKILWTNQSGEFNSLPCHNHVHENLVKDPGKDEGFPKSVFKYFRCLLSGKKNDAGSRTEEEEKVYSWLYALSKSNKDLVFEYVRSTERGLSFNEADRRLKENGPNVPIKYTFPRWWNLLWNAFFHPFNIILIVVSVLSYITSDSPNGCIMLVLVFISVSLRFYQEYGSSKAAMKLSELVRCPVKVQRCAGRVVQTELIVQVDQQDIVPGDIVIFEPGDLFPGDVRVLSSKNLVVKYRFYTTFQARYNFSFQIKYIITTSNSQSSLTGESWTTDKTADINDQNTPILELKNICFMGTNVVSGCGIGLVISTGSKTYMSTMFSTIGKKNPPDSFENGIRSISYVLIGVMLVVMTIIILADYFKSKDVSESLLFGLSVACALTPNILPLIVNTSLAKGALAMARDRCIVKSLAAIRYMGSMDILCIDKTGTLTMNHAIVVSHLDSWGLTKEKVLRFAFLNSYFKTDQKYPLDDAILAHVYTNGYRFQPSKWSIVDEIPFDFVRRRVSVILETDLLNAEGRKSRVVDRIMVSKGALEEVLKVCSFIDNVDGNSTKILSSEDYQRILLMAEELSNQGLRAIGVAVKRLETRGNPVMAETDIESDMIFVGVITFFDPPKDSAKQALWRLAEKGVKAKVLTGDSLSLAIRICKELGIRTTHVTTGPDLELLDQESFHETVKRATVLARLTPTQKLRVVKSLQTVGDHVVGFLGDGVNDSLAIDAADVGISVDSGASVAKDFADIVLLEKDLNVLLAGVEHGRLTLGNTMKYIKMSVVANIGSVLSILIATLLLQFEPLSPKQLLTQTFIYTLGQVAIPWDKMEEDYVKTPRKWPMEDLPLFILWNFPVCTFCDLANLFFLWAYYSDYQKLGIPLFQSAWFVEGLLMQTLVFHLIRTEKIPFVQEVASWPVICSTVVISAIGIGIPFTPVGKVMGFVHLPISYFGFLVVLFVGYFTLGQLAKMVYLLIYKKWL